MMSNLIKISDLVIDELYRNGVDTIFGVTGGAVVHFFDSANSHPNVSTVFFNHEQSAAFAAEAYAKFRNNLGAGIFTTGPGATNSLTGLAAAWLDSIPTIFISGQVPTNHSIKSRNLRQVGTQEIDIISMVKSVTKYSVTILDIREVKYHLNKAIFLAKQGRPGPVWLDIPVDISWSSIDMSELIEFYPSKEFPGFDKNDIADQSQNLNDISETLLVANRPLILAGFGARLSNAEKALTDFAEKHQLPIVTSWNICDMIESDHPLNVGRPGMAGHRGANLAIQNCDFLLCLGSHLNSSITGKIYEAFAREAQIAVVDIDINELNNISVHVDWKVNSDVGNFLKELDRLLGEKRRANEPLLNWSRLYSRYQDLNNVSNELANQEENINSYFLKDLISKKTKGDEIFVVDGGGTVVYSAFQSCNIKKGQRLILSTGLCSMGSGIPESIGVSYGARDKRVICFIGDGSFPFNMQELQLIKDQNLPIKIFVFNNEGYVSIQTTQTDFLDGNFVGSNPASGLSLPNIKNVTTAFGIEYFTLNNHAEALDQIDFLLEKNGPFICEVKVSSDQEIIPRQGFAKSDDGSFKPRPLEDMYPFLDRKTYESLMVVSEWRAQSNENKGREINLLKSYPKSDRPIEEREAKKLSGIGYMPLETEKNNEETVFEQLLLKKAREFGDVYFDGDRLFGYGGYNYNKKYWCKVAEDIIDFYKLKEGDKVLDIGCAKGFLLNDLKSHLTGLQVFGIDISKYAVDRAMPSVKGSIYAGNACSLPFSNNEFDLVLSINTLSELDDIDCRKGITEIERVSKNNAYIVLNSWSNAAGKDRLLKWNLTALSNHSKQDWKNIFKQEGYGGDYYWFDLSQ
jgi:acetolactate synthase-1/2/3 large subunit